MKLEVLETLLRPVIEDLECILWGCEYFPSGKNALLRIIIDKTTGVGISDCERVSKQVAAVLDVEEPLAGNYRLEVSSPGIPRPIFRPWHYEYCYGKPIKVKLYDPIENTRTIIGVIEAVDGNDVVLRDGEVVYRLALSNISKANLTVE